MCKTLSIIYLIIDCVMLCVRYAKLTYSLLQFAFAVLTVSFTPLFYYCYTAHTVYIIVLLLVLTWQGGAYYVHRLAPSTVT